MRSRTGLWWGIALVLIGLVGLGLTSFADVYYSGTSGGFFSRICPWCGGDRSDDTSGLSDFLGGDSGHMGFMMRDYSKSSYSSEGERIFLTGTDTDGRIITRSGGMMMHMQVGCANCHGPDGKGGLVFPDGTESPDIRWKTLAAGEEEEGEEGHVHEPYTEEAFKRTVTLGIEPDGEEMSYLMPRWRMTDSDLDHLIEYLKTLD